MGFETTRQLSQSQFKALQRTMIEAALLSNPNVVRNFTTPEEEIKEIQRAMEICFKVSLSLYPDEEVARKMKERDQGIIG